MTALEYAQRLAVVLHDKHYPEVAKWQVGDEMMLVLTQIDNMTSMLVRPKKQ